MPFDLAGFAVDKLRSCYETLMFVPGAQPSEFVLGRWFFTDKPPLPLVTCYNSLNWIHPEDKGSPGEIKGEPRRWVNGSAPPNLPAVFRGDANAFLGKQTTPLYDVRTWCPVAEPFELGLSVVDSIGDGEAVSDQAELDLGLSDSIGGGIGVPDSVELAVSVSDSVGTGEPVSDLAELGLVVSDLVGTGEPVSDLVELALSVTDSVEVNPRTVDDGIEIVVRVTDDVSVNPLPVGPGYEIVIRVTDSVSTT